MYEIVRYVTSRSVHSVFFYFFYFLLEEYKKIFLK